MQDYITARELHWIYHRPMSTIYRIMNECESRTVIRDDLFGLRAVVKEKEFVKVMISKKPGNPRFRTDPAFQRENSARAHAPRLIEECPKLGTSAAPPEGVSQIGR